MHNTNLRNKQLISSYSMCFVNRIHTHQFLWDLSCLVCMSVFYLTSYSQQTGKTWTFPALISRAMTAVKKPALESDGTTTDEVKQEDELNALEVEAQECEDFLEAINEVRFLSYSLFLCPSLFCLIMYVLRGRPVPRWTDSVPTQKKLNFC
jgi:hypothetical protein